MVQEGEGDGEVARYGIAATPLRHCCKTSRREGPGREKEDGMPTIGKKLGALLASVLLASTLGLVAPRGFGQVFV